MVANTILQQLGGHGFAVMTGSRNFISLGNGLQMSLARNRTSANRLKIILDEDTDTYTMYFYRQTLTKYADIKVKDIDFTPISDPSAGGEICRPLLLTVSRRRLKSSKKPFCSHFR